MCNTAENKVEKKPKNETELILDTIKVIGLVLGGCWIAYQYFAHDRIIKETEYQKSVKENEIKSIELQYANTIKNAEIKALELQNSGRNIDLKYKELDSQLTIASQDVENKLNELKLKTVLNEKYKVELDIAVERKGKSNPESQVYVIKPNLEITNSSVHDMEISAVIVEIFSNNLSYRHLEDDELSKVMLDIPPNIFFKYKSSLKLPHGEVKLSMPSSQWDKVGYDFNLLEESKNFLIYEEESIIKEYSHDHLYSYNGLGTGVYKPEETTSIRPIYYVRMNPAQILGISVNVVFNKGNQGRRFFTDHYVQVLEELE